VYKLVFSSFFLFKKAKPRMIIDNYFTYK